MTYTQQKVCLYASQQLLQFNMLYYAQTTIILNTDIYFISCVENIKRNLTRMISIEQQVHMKWVNPLKIRQNFDNNHR